MRALRLRDVVMSEESAWAGEIVTESCDLRPLLMIHSCLALISGMAEV